MPIPDKNSKPNEIIKNRKRCENDEETKKYLKTFLDTIDVKNTYHETLSIQYYNQARTLINKQRENPRTPFEPIIYLLKKAIELENDTIYYATLIETCIDYHHESPYFTAYEQDEAETHATERAEIQLLCKPYIEESLPQINFDNPSDADIIYIAAFKQWRLGLEMSRDLLVSLKRTTGETNEQFIKTWEQTLPDKGINLAPLYEVDVWARYEEASLLAREIPLPQVKTTDTTPTSSPTNKGEEVLNEEAQNKSQKRDEILNKKTDTKKRE